MGVGVVRGERGWDGPDALGDCVGGREGWEGGCDGGEEFHDGGVKGWLLC